MISRSRALFVVGALMAAATGAAIAADVAGADDSNASSFVPITPCRLLDTRPAPDTIGTRSTPLAAGETHTVPTWGTNGNCSIPSGATALSLNVVAIGPTASSYLTVFPADAPRPTASSLNWVANQAPTPNGVTAAVAADGRLSFYNLAGTVNLAVDVVGYYQLAAAGGVGPAGAAGVPGPPGPQGPPGVDPARVVWVAESGGDFTTISAALASITDNDATHRYLVKVAPGRYVEDDSLQMKSYVDVEGSGPGTVIVSDGGDDATVIQIPDPHVQVRHLRIDASQAELGVYITSPGPAESVQLVDVSLEAVAAVEHSAIVVYNANATLDGVRVDVSGPATRKEGLLMSQSSEVVVRHSAFTVVSPSTSTDDCTGIAGLDSWLDISDSEVTVMNCSGSVSGVQMGLSDLDMDGVEVSVGMQGGTTGTAVQLTDSEAEIDRSHLATTGPGNGYGVSVDGGEVMIRDAIVDGPDNSVRRLSGAARLHDSELRAVTSGMSGLCLGNVDVTLTTYTCA